MLIMSESNQERAAKIFEIYRSEAISSRSDGDAIIFGTDDRKDYFEIESDDLLKKLADATVILANKDSITQQADGTYKLAVSPFRVSGFSPCIDESFKNQRTGGWCSGFMVGSDVIVTAGHCVETEARAKDTAYIFGFYVKSSGDPGTKTFRADQVYFGKELIAQRKDTLVGDFAIVRVDRKITAPGATPLKIRKTGRIMPGQKVGAIGYPSGLPVKIAFGNQTIFIREEDPWLIANLDTYKGNSGSAVFNSDGLVEGILSQGSTDYVLDNNNSCFRSIKIEDSEGNEKVTKASAFVSLIPSDRS